MTPSLPRLAALGLCVAALTACGGPEPANPEQPLSLSGSDTTVSVTDSKFGPILVGQQGRTLYSFSADTACTADCLRDWPAYVAEGVPYGAQQTLSILDLDELGVVDRPDGTKQVAYMGRPLHYHAADTQQDAVTGQDVTAYDRTWHAVSPGGSLVTR